MIFSAEQRFSEGQNLTATGGSTNLIDLGAPGTVLGAPAALPQDIGKGRPIPIVVQLAADSAGTSPTIVVTLENDNDVAFGSATTVATATLVAGDLDGDRINLQWIPEGTAERYLRLLYTLAGTSPDYTLDAGIVLADQTND